MRPSRDHRRGYKSAVRALTTVMAIFLNGTIAILAVTTAGAQSASAPGADEVQVRALMRSIYARYNQSIGSGSLPSYSPSTDAMYEQYNVLTQNEDISDLSGFDHFCECQDFDEKTSRLLGVTIVRVAPDLIDATARYVLSSEDKGNTTRIRFQKTGTWKIHDVFWSRSGGSLRGTLTETIAEHARATKPSVAQKSGVPQGSVAQQPAAPAPTMAVPAVSACGGNPRCAEVASFVATVTSVRESQITNVGSPIRLAAVTVRFRNNTNAPLFLGYVAGSGVLTDDRGNRYMPDSRRLRGIGEVGFGAIDPKFILRPGESGDAQFEFAWQPRGALIGTHPVIDLAIREIESIPGNQWQLGREHALHFSGFDGPPNNAVAASAPAASSSAGAPPASSAATDACAKKLDCFSAGPFVAEITRMAQSQSERFRDIQFSVRFQNLTAQPLVLGQTQWSTLVVDDLGNRYTSAWTALPEVRGMGLVRTGQQADPSFVLQPGASREANYAVRFDAGAARLGSVYNVDFAVEELELLPANQVRSVRQFPVGFRDVKIARWRGWRNLIDIRIQKQ